MKTLSAFLVFSMVLTYPFLSHSRDYDARDDLKVFEGAVVSVDTDKSELTVKGDVVEVFPVTGQTELSKDANDIGLSDIVPGNYVSVGYYVNDDGALTVLNITVEYETIE